MSDKTAETVNGSPASPEIDVSRSGQRNPVLRALSFRNISAIYVFVALVAIFAIWVPDTFLTATTWRSLLDTQVITALVAVGLCVPLAAGVFDLSVGLAVGTGSMVASVMLVQAGLPTPLAIAIALGTGVLIGLVNGLVVTILRVDSFITTLGMQALLIAFVQWISAGQQVLGLPPDFQRLASGQLAGITYPVYFLVIVAVIVWYVLERTPLGRRLYATGGNIEAARLAGVRTKPLIVLAFVVSSVVAAFAGLLLAARLGTGDPTVGADYLLPAFSAAFLGSTQFKNGRFNVWGTVLSVYVLATGVKGLQLAGAPVWLPYLFNGVVLIVAVALSKVQARQRIGAPARRGLFRKRSER